MKNKLLKYEDSIGRIWTIDRKTVVEDYIQCIMQMNEISYEDAKVQVMNGNDFWMFEQIESHPELFFVYATMIKDISAEQKEIILDKIGKNNAYLIDE